MNKILFFPSSVELLRVPVESVVYIGANGNYSSIKLVDGTDYVLTMQLGQIEDRINNVSDDVIDRFVRIGKSLIINREYIMYISPSRQKLTLSDGKSFRHEVSASREALRSLKEHIEKQQI